MSKAQAKAFVYRQSAMQDSDRNAYHDFAVTLRTAGQKNGQLIGDVGIFLPAGEDRTGDLGFQFDPAYHGKGYATEAATAFVKHAFITWNLDRMTSNCDAENHKSARLILRLGFTPVPVPYGQNHLSFELKRETWLANQNAV